MRNSHIEFSLPIKHPTDWGLPKRFEQGFPLDWMKQALEDYDWSACSGCFGWVVVVGVAFVLVVFALSLSPVFNARACPTLRFVLLSLWHL